MGIHPCGACKRFVANKHKLQALTGWQGEGPAPMPGGVPHRWLLKGRVLKLGRNENRVRQYYPVRDGGGQPAPRKQEAALAALADKNRRR